MNFHNGHNREPPLFLWASLESGKIKRRRVMRGLIVRAYIILFYGLASQELFGNLYMVEIIPCRIPGIGSKTLQNRYALYYGIHPANTPRVYRPPPVAWRIYQGPALGALPAIRPYSLFRRLDQAPIFGMRLPRSPGQIAALTPSMDGVQRPSVWPLFGHIV
jgi:hypothetical protein